MINRIDKDPIPDEKSNPEQSIPDFPAAREKLAAATAAATCSRRHDAGVIMMNLPSFFI